MDKLRFFSLGSGSSGNCYYIGNAKRGILIDAGIGARSIKKRLKSAPVTLLKPVCMEQPSPWPSLISQCPLSFSFPLQSF